MATESGNLEFGASSFEKFKLLKQRLRDVDKQIRNAFNKSVRAAVAPLKDEVKKSAHDKLPRKGGLADKVSGSKFATRTSASGLSLNMTNLFQLKDIDEGKLRHPVFGHMNVWANQKINSGFWTEPTTKAQAEIVASVNEAMDEVIKEIDKE